MSTKTTEKLKAELKEAELPKQPADPEKGATETFYVRVTGIDRPGILTSLLAVLSHCQATVRDIEQITIRQRMILGLIVSLPANGSQHTRPDLLRPALLRLGKRPECGI